MEEKQHAAFYYPSPAGSSLHYSEHFSPRWSIHYGLNPTKDLSPFGRQAYGLNQVMNRSIIRDVFVIDLFDR